MDLQMPLKAASQFDGIGEIFSVEPYGSGHINQTFMVKCSSGEYILQQISTSAFPHPEQVMSNMTAVCSYLQGKIDARGKNCRDRTIHLMKTKSGSTLFHDDTLGYWRMYHFIDHVISLNLPDSPESFRQSGSAFGQFARDLDGFPADSLYETILNFHNTPHRIEHFKQVVSADKMNRAAGVQREIDAVLSRQENAGKLTSLMNMGKLPLRVTHNDTKLNNVLLDEETRKPVAVIDLDTIMPGLVAYDFGDAIRFGASTAVEDEADTSKIHFSMPMFAAFAEGYLESAGSMLSPEEILSLPQGAWTMTYEVGMRFLDDYLDGDNYFHIAYPEHNLVRARNQLTLLADMECHMDEMLDCVKKIGGVENA